MYIITMSTAPKTQNFSDMYMSFLKKRGMGGREIKITEQS